MVEVRQEDREAAASGYFAWIGGNRTIPEKMRNGITDDHSMVQAFARHREAAEAECEARTVAAIVAWLRGPALSAWGADCSGASETDYYADAIERGEWREQVR